MSVISQIPASGRFRNSKKWVVFRNQSVVKDSPSTDKCMESKNKSLGFILEQVFLNSMKADAGGQSGAHGPDATRESNRLNAAASPCAPKGDNL
jgi:hypothetical protein